MSEQSASSVTPTVPSAWPGAFGLYKYSRNAIQYNLGTILGLIALSLGSSIVLSILGGNNTPTKYIFEVVSQLVGIWIAAATVFAVLASVRSAKITFSETLSKGWAIFFKFLVLTLMMFAIMIVSLLLLVVPFFIVMPRLVLAPYYLADKDLEPVDALKASWDGTKGHVGKFWGITGATIAMALLIVVLVGFYFLVMYSAAMALLYAFVSKTNK